MDWGGDYEKDRVRGRNVWDSQFLNTILTVITLAIVDLFFAVSKVARRGCTSGALSTFFLQLREDLENEHETGFRPRWSVNLDILPCYSLCRRSYFITTTNTSPLPRDRHKKRSQKDETRLTSSGFSSFSFSASSLAVSFSFTSPPWAQKHHNV